MIGYITLGSNNIAQSAQFYDALFEKLNINRVLDYPQFVAWGYTLKDLLFCITEPNNQEVATTGNGVMIGLKTESEKQVDELHALALSLGALNEGDPGLRKSGYYCAYFRDLEGNKINFHFAKHYEN